MMDKSALRRKLKADRRLLSQAELKSLSQRIIQKLIKAHDWRTTRQLHCFVPIDGLNEIDTRQFFEYIWHSHPKVETFTTQRHGNLVRVRPGFLYQPAEDSDFDVVVAPMLGFDDSLHRIGYGGGYYDKLLALHPEARKIGLCFATGRQESIPTEPHDIALDTILTELL